MYWSTFFSSFSLMLASFLAWVLVYFNKFLLLSMLVDRFIFPVLPFSMK